MLIIIDARGFTSWITFILHGRQVSGCSLVFWLNRPPIFFNFYTLNRWRGFCLINKNLSLIAKTKNPAVTTWTTFAFSAGLAQFPPTSFTVFWPNYPQCSSDITTHAIRLMNSAYEEDPHSPHPFLHAQQKKQACKSRLIAGLE